MVITKRQGALFFKSEYNFTKEKLKSKKLIDKKGLPQNQTKIIKTSSNPFKEYKGGSMDALNEVI